MRHTAQRDDATLTNYQIPIQWAFEHSLALGVDRGELRFECGLPIGNELPLHWVEPAFPVDQA